MIGLTRRLSGDAREGWRHAVHRIAAEFGSPAERDEASARWRLPGGDLVVTIAVAGVARLRLNASYGGDDPETGARLRAVLAGLRR